MAQLDTGTGVITSIEDALISILKLEGIKCLDYEPIGAGFAPPIATLCWDKCDVGYLDNDQGFGIGHSEWTLRYYVTLETNERLAHNRLKAGTERIYRALGNDRTLGGVCASSHIEGTQTFIASGGKRPLLFIECKFTAIPNPNIGY